MEQVKGKKVYLIGFVPPSTMTGPEVDISYPKHEWPKCKKQRTMSAVSKSNSVCANTHYIGEVSAINPKSMSVADLLKAGKLVKPPKQERVTLKNLMFTRDLGTKQLPLSS